MKMPDTTINKSITPSDSFEKLTVDAFKNKVKTPMAGTCSLFYGSRLKFSGEFWLYYPIDKTEVPILYNLNLI